MEVSFRADVIGKLTAEFKDHRGLSVFVKATDLNELAVKLKLKQFR